SHFNVRILLAPIAWSNRSHARLESGGAMSRLLRFSVDHPKTILGLAVSITLLLGLFIPRVRLGLDARSLVPAGHTDLARSEASAALCGLRDAVVTGVANRESGIYNT